MKVYNNIEILQVDFTGDTDRIYFPQNSKIQGKKINSVCFFYKGANDQLNWISPLTLNPIIDEAIAAKMFCDIVNDDKEILQHNIPVTANSIIANNVIEVNDIIDLELCQLRYVGDLTDLVGKSMLIYVFYDDIIVDDDIIGEYQSVTVTIPITSIEPIQLSDYIDDYIIANKKTIKKIETVSYDASFYVDLQDFGGRSFRYLPSKRLLRPSIFKNITPNNAILLNDFNLDFNNSYVVAASTDNIGKSIVLTFYF